VDGLPALLHAATFAAAAVRQRALYVKMGTVHLAAESVWLQFQPSKASTHCADCHANVCRAALQTV
jgi:hypothetical protein